MEDRDDAFLVLTLLTDEELSHKWVCKSYYTFYLSLDVMVQSNPCPMMSIRNKQRNKKQMG